jgi:hypothetical protein
VTARGSTHGTLPRALRGKSKWRSANNWAKAQEFRPDEPHPMRQTSTEHDWNLLRSEVVLPRHMR